MELPLTIPVIRYTQEKIIFSIALCMLVIGGVFAFPLSYVSNSNELIGLCLLPFVLAVRQGNRFNYVFFLLFIAFGIGAWSLHVRMFYFFALAFYLFWVIELLWGAVNLLSVFLLGWMSPFFFQVSVILGFPIRLQLSEIAGSLLQQIGVNVIIEGNMMLLNGNSFTVDEACMGLHMLAMTLLMGVFILAHASKVFGKSLGVKLMLGFFVLAFLLNVISNLFRIMLLVLFKVAPANPLHDVIGILCMIFYILIPLYYVGQWATKKYGFTPMPKSNNLRLSWLGKTSVVCIALTLLAAGVRIHQQRTQSGFAHATVHAPGYVITEIDDGVTKLVNEEALIYIKPIPEFFSGEHTPLLCWKGSGYSFSKIQKEHVLGHEIYMGQLVKDDQVLYTAWWYDNASVQTIDQFDWRLRMLRGEKNFALVNITSHDVATLKENIEVVLAHSLLLAKH